MYFLTYNDLPSGIYKSQVIDVVKYLNSIQKDEKVRLLALISLRDFSKNRRKIREVLPDAIVLPMFPKAQFWRSNYFILFFVFLFCRQNKVVARGPFACKLSLRLKRAGLVNKVIFDGRGAYYAELTEYEVVKSESVKRDIAMLEKQVVLESDFRLAVSQALVNYWKKEFGYTSGDHVVIPCTLGHDFVFDFPAEAELEKLRSENGFKTSDVVFIYSGSAAGWQSFDLVDAFMSKLMDENSNVKLIILSPHFGESAEVVRKHRDKIKITWLSQSEVKNYLLLSDYGILFREETITNKVASPVKFAEYLSCGLKVFISNNLGDYTEFSGKNDLRFTKSERPVYSEKKRIHELSYSEFLKNNYRKEYLELIY